MRRREEEKKGRGGGGGEEEKKVRVEEDKISRSKGGRRVEHCKEEKKELRE